MELFLLKKNDVKFCPTVVSGWRNIGHICLDLESDKRFVKKKFWI